jgi:hypothetical protein
MNVVNSKGADQPQGDSPLRPSQPTGPSRPAAALDRIGEALEGLRYGSVLVIVQDGVVIQIERTEKTRIGKNER